MRLNSGKVVVVILLALAVALIFYIRLDAHGYDWRHYDSPDGKFSIELPGAPATEDKPATSATGGSFVGHSVVARASAQAGYACSWREDPSLKGLSDQELLDRDRDWGLYGVRGKLISDRRITVQGFPALDVVGSGQGNSAYDNRLIIVGPRIYSLMVVDTSGRHDSANIAHFFNSFILH